MIKKTMATRNKIIPISSLNNANAPTEVKINKPPMIPNKVFIGEV